MRAENDHVASRMRDMTVLDITMGDWRLKKFDFVL